MFLLIKNNNNDDDDDDDNNSFQQLRQVEILFRYLVSIKNVIYKEIVVRVNELCVVQKIGQKPKMRH